MTSKKLAGGLLMVELLVGIVVSSLAVVIVPFVGLPLAIAWGALNWWAMTQFERPKEPVS